VSRNIALMVFYLAVFLQAGAYGLTFMLPRLFEGLGSDEKAVGTMLMFTALSTLFSVYYCGHLSDAFGRVRMLARGVWRSRLLWLFMAMRQRLAV
jgi:MFS family permease